MDQIENILNQFSDNTNLKRYLNSLENLNREENQKKYEEIYLPIIQNEKKQSVNSLPLRQYSCRLRRGYTDHPEKRPIRRRGILPSKHRNNLRRLWAQNRCPS